MKLGISRTAALSAALAAAAARTFIDLALDANTIHNGAWISALLGALPAIPYLLCLDAICGKRPAKPLLLPLAVVTALDAAQVFSIVTRVSVYLSLDHVPDLALILPVALATLWCVWRNGDAIGYAAALWARAFPLLMLVVILLQMRHYHTMWLHPLLGNGWREIVAGGARTSGWFVPATAILLARGMDAGKTESRCSAAWIALAAAVSAVLLILRLMMTPTGAYAASWLARLDALLTNGRAPLYLQLPMILAFFIGALHLLACECFAASALMQRAFPALNGRACGAIVVLASAACATSGLSRPFMDRLAPWLFCAAAIPVAMIVLRDSKGGERPCEG